MAARKNPTDERLIALFLDMLAAERGAGANTLSAYRHDLADLAQHLGAAKKSIASATTDDLRDYLGSLAKRGLKPSSVARRLSALRQLYRFLYAEGHITTDPAAVLEDVLDEKVSVAAAAADYGVVIHEARRQIDGPATGALRRRPRSLRVAS